MGYKDRDTILNDGVNIYDGEDLVDDVANRPHDQAFANEDYLASVVNADRTFVVQGGGTLSWQTDTPLKFTWSEPLRIEWANEEIGSGVGGSSYANINAGSVTFTASQRLLAVRISRSIPTTYTSASLEKFASFDDLKSQLETLAAGDQSARFEYLVLAVREKNTAGNYTGNLILWDKRKMIGPVSWTEAAPSPPAVTTFGTYLTHDGARDGQYAQQQSLNYLNTVADQDRNTLLMGGGLMTWSNDSGVYRLITADDLYVYLPTGVYVKIAAQTWPVIQASQGYKITISRSTGETTQNPVVVDLATVSDSGDNLIIVAAMHDDNRLYLRDGSAFDPGQKRYLGGGTTGLKWLYEGPGNGAAVLTFNGSYPTGGSVKPVGVDPAYLVGGVELLVFVNGQLKRRDALGSGTSGDYQEVGTAGSLSRQIKWLSPSGPPQTRIPTSSDWVQCFVGLAYARGETGPSGGVSSLIEPTGTAGSLVGDISLQSTDSSVLITKTAESTVNFTVSPNFSMSQGQRNAVNGAVIEAFGGVDGAMIVFGHRPIITGPLWEEGEPSTSEISVSPGEVPVPTSVDRISFRVLRNYSTTTWNIASAGSRAADFSIVSGETAVVYAYAFADSVTVHDATFGVEFSTTPPGDGSTGNWLTHPTYTDRVYIGSFAATFTDPGYEIVPFNRVGSQIRFQPAFRQVTITTPLTEIQDLAALDSGEELIDLVPETATGIIFGISALADGSGNTDTGILLGGGLVASSLALSPSPIGDVILRFSIAADARMGWPEVVVPNTSWGSGPEVSAYIGDNLNTVVFYLLGYVEDLPKLGLP